MVIEELMKHGPKKAEERRGLKETENLDENIEPKYKAKKRQCLQKLAQNKMKIKQIKELVGFQKMMQPKK